MPDEEFDPLGRQIGHSYGASLNRRALLGAIGFGTLASTNEAELLPTRAVVSIRGSRLGGPSIEQTAFDLMADIDAIFKFVRDEVIYDPYPGCLRGALGTLWGRSGNSV